MYLSSNEPYEVAACEASPHSPQIQMQFTKSETKSSQDGQGRGCTSMEQAYRPPPAARSDEMHPQAAACPSGRASQTRSCVTAPSRWPPRSPGTAWRTPTTRRPTAVGGGRGNARSKARGGAARMSCRCRLQS